MDYIQPYLDYFSANPEWAIAIIFLIAMGEALLIIGLFVPSTAVLVGAGVLVGTGNLQFWPVFIATADGVVLVADHWDYLGNLVVIDHGFGFTTRYGHMASFNVKEGDRVKRFQVIGYVGNTGRSSAPHLHYEVRYFGKPLNPMNFIID